MDLSGKHVLITGASRGVGAAATDEFRTRGARLSLFSRSVSVEGHLTNAADLCVVSGDLISRLDIENAVNQFEDRFGPVDVLINNAGFGRYEPFVESAPETIEQTIATNLTGLVLLTHRVLPAMIKRKSGLIIHIASDLGQRPLANMAVYSATKHAVVGFSQSLARELRSHNVRSTVVLPGLIDSYFGGRSPGEVPQDASLTPEDVARAVVYIAESPDEVLIDEYSFRSRGQDV